MYIKNVFFFFFSNNGAASTINTVHFVGYITSMETHIQMKNVRKLPSLWTLTSTHFHTQMFTLSSHNPLLTAQHLRWPRLPVFIMAVGKQSRGDADFFLSLFVLIWRRLTNYYRRFESAKPKACGHTGILRYKSVKSLSLEHEPYCCEAGYRTGARAVSHTGLSPCPRALPMHRSHYWLAVALIASLCWQQ